MPLVSSHKLLVVSPHLSEITKVMTANNDSGICYLTVCASLCCDGESGRGMLEKENSWKSMYDVHVCEREREERDLKTEKDKMCDKR